MAFTSDRKKSNFKNYSTKKLWKHNEVYFNWNRILSDMVNLILTFELVEGLVIARLAAARTE